MRFARRSFGDDHPCQYDWPEDCLVQCGGNGIVFTGTKSLDKILTTAEGNADVLDILAGVPTDQSFYRTAFFEAFPRNPDTFIRGEGASIEEAEEKTWLKYQKYLNCSEHEFERRKYTNGCGVCKHCGMFKSDVFEPLTKCYLCGTPTAYGLTRDDEHFCEDCEANVPREKWPQWRLDLDTEEA